MDGHSIQGKKKIFRNYRKLIKFILDRKFFISYNEYIEIIIRGDPMEKEKNLS